MSVAGLMSKFANSRIVRDWIDQADLEHIARDVSDPKARSTVVMMTPKDFLRMASRDTADAAKTKGVREHAESGGKFTPNSLEFKVQADGSAKVTGHEGRHRARWYINQGLGDEPMPVTFRSLEGEHGAIRWGETDFRPGTLWNQDAATGGGFAGIEPWTIGREVPFPKGVPFGSVLAGSGSGLLGAGALLGSQEAEAAPLGTLGKLLGIPTRSAHHGSPHDFDKFSSAKIGTGEGVQAYGHGLYFTSKEDIAKYYRDELSRRKRNFSYKGEPLSKNHFGDPEKDSDLWVFLEETEDLADAKQEIQRAINHELRRLKHPSGQVRFAAERSRRDLTEIQKVIDDLEETFPKGKLYDVEIPDESLMLDWDMPLSEQPEKVRKALLDSGQLDLEAFADDMSGQDVYGSFGMTAERGVIEHSGRRASQELRELGIPGLTYKGATSGERNFVVFDDEMINLVNKRAIDPSVALAGGAAMGGPLAGNVPESVQKDMAERPTALGDFMRALHPSRVPVKIQDIPWRRAPELLVDLLDDSESAY